MEILNIKDRPDFIPAVARWIFEEWGHIRSRAYQEIVQRLTDACVDQFPFTLVAIMNNEPVGTAALKAHDMDILQEYTPWLAGVYVPPVHRGKLIASRLVAEVELRAADLGFERAYLFTATATELYNRLGWIPLHELEYDGLNVVVMHKALKAQTTK